MASFMLAQSGRKDFFPPENRQSVVGKKDEARDTSFAKSQSTQKSETESVKKIAKNRNL
jgi:hypothetical protein